MSEMARATPSREVREVRLMLLASVYKGEKRLRGFECLQDEVENVATEWSWISRME